MWASTNGGIFTYLSQFRGGRDCPPTSTRRRRLRSRGSWVRTMAGERVPRHHEMSERDVGGARFEWDRVNSEVLEHLENGLEPQVLHATLARVYERQA